MAGALVSVDIGRISHRREETMLAGWGIRYRPPGVSTSSITGFHLPNYTIKRNSLASKGEPSCHNVVVATTAHAASATRNQRSPLVRRHLFED